MTPRILQRFLASAMICLVIYNGHAQNLIPNHSMEEYGPCPTNWTLPGGTLSCQPWIIPTGGTSDYFNACAILPVADVPDNFIGHQFAYTGDAYCGIIVHTFIPQYREYLQIQLTEPLQAGSTYRVSFQVSLADMGCPVVHLGAYISVVAPTSSNASVLNVVPQIETNGSLLNNSLSWVEISGCYLASGGEEYITIGSFRNDANTILDPACTFDYAYYYVDHVVVDTATPGELIFDLGAPVEECGEYTINPGIPSGYFNWSDGSHGTTLTVTESGTYSVTITSGCDTGEDEIDVVILENEELELEDLVSFCDGDSYTVELEPTMGQYTWDDGSHELEYVITTEGTYGVTLENFCGTFSDAIEVDVLYPPLPVSLGNDTILCDEATLELYFDPDLGDFLWSTGSTDNEIEFDEAGEYSLTISNTCGEETDDLEIEIVLFPEIQINPDELILCEDEEFEIELDPDIGNYIWQDGETSPTYLITEAGLYSVTVSNFCGANYEEILVLTPDPPQLDLGEDVTICPSQLPYTLDVSETPNGETFIWDDDSTNPFIEVTTGGFYSVTVSNQCHSVSDLIQITVEDGTPVFDLPAQIVMCAADTVLLDPQVQNANYLWQDASTNSTFQVTSAGIYSVTVSNDCGSAVDAVDVELYPALPVPDLGADFSLCPGEEAVLSANNPNAQIAWQDGSTADTFLVTNAGVYILQFSNQCAIVSDTVNVTVDNNPPTLALPDQLTLCQGSSLIIDAGVNGVSYQWSDLSQNASISVTNPGNYSLTVSNSCGADADTVSVIDGGPAPLVSLGADVGLCPGASIEITPQFTDVDSWTWQDGSTAGSYTVNAPGTIFITVNNSCGSNVDSLVISPLPATPGIDLGADTVLCPGTEINLLVNTNGAGITWSDGTTDETFTISAEGQYYATLSNVCGANVDTIDITLLPDVPALNLGNDQSLCPGEVITISPLIADVDYLWQDGSTSDTYNATQAGLIYLTISNTCGSNTDSLLITESTQGPVVDLGPDVQVCEGEMVTLVAGISGVNYLWQDGSTNATFDAVSTGTYILEVSNNCGVDRDTVDIVIEGVAPGISLGPDTTLCVGASLTLHATGDATTSFTWQDGSVTASYVVTEAGLYSLKAINQCGEDSDTVLVDMLAPPSPFDIGRDTVLCPGESLVLIVPQSGTEIEWQDGSHAFEYVANKAQTYSLELANACGTARDEFILGYDENSPLLALPPMVEICPGDVVTLDATQEFPATYLWSSDEASSTITVTTAGEYSVTVTALCDDGEGSVIIVEKDDCYPVSIFIPNVFSPNQDNVNDYFSLVFNAEINVLNVQGEIFDRWGDLVFHSAALPFSWDGRSHDKWMQPGVYVYQIEVEYEINGQVRKERLYGDVTLIR